MLIGRSASDLVTRFVTSIERVGSVMRRELHNSHGLTDYAEDLCSARNNVKELVKVQYKD